MNNDEKLSTMMAHFLSGYARSKAIQEDYVQLAAKIEGIDEQQVKDRLDKRTQEIFKEVQEKLRTDLS